MKASAQKCPKRVSKISTKSKQKIFASNEKWSSMQNDNYVAAIASLLFAASYFMPAPSNINQAGKKQTFFSCNKFPAKNGHQLVFNKKISTGFKSTNLRIKKSSHSQSLENTFRYIKIYQYISKQKAFFLIILQHTFGWLYLPISFFLLKATSLYTSGIRSHDP
jgi:hypothetical protein